jgi:hypothetical protein
LRKERVIPREVDPRTQRVGRDMPARDTSPDHDHPDITRDMRSIVAVEETIGQDQEMTSTDTIDVTDMKDMTEEVIGTDTIEVVAEMEETEMKEREGLTLESQKTLARKS